MIIRITGEDYCVKNRRSDSGDKPRNSPERQKKNSDGVSDRPQTMKNSRQRSESAEKSDGRYKPSVKKSKRQQIIGQPIDSKTGRRRLTRQQKIKIAAVSIVCVLILFVLGGFMVWRSLLDQVTLVDPEKETLPSEYDHPTESLINPVPNEKGVLNILLLGVDSRDPGNFDGRSDSMMILTINEKQGRIKLTSLQRDMLMYLPGRDMPEKINAANVFGGPALAMRVINDALRLDIKNYVVVNMSGMEGIIDIAGGVMIDVQEEEVPYLNKNTTSERISSAGLQKLDGGQAVSYARIRKLDSDYVRMQRQRIVLQALLDAFNEADLINKGQMISEGLSMITTNLRASEMTDLGLKMLPKMNSTIEQLQLPIEGYFIEHSGVSWTIRADFNGMIPLLQEFIWGRTFPFDPVKDIPGAPDSSIPLPTRPPTEAAPTRPPTAAPEPEPTPEPSPSPQVATPTPPAVTPEPTDETTTAETEPSDEPSETTTQTETETETEEPTETTVIPTPAATPTATPAATPAASPTPTPADSSGDNPGGGNQKPADPADAS